MSRHFELEGPNRGPRLRLVDVQETRGGGGVLRISRERDE